MVRQPRSTQRYQGAEREEEKRLIERMRELSVKHPRYGYKRITAMLRLEGWRVNRKRVNRIWREEGLKVVQRQRKRRARGNSGNSCESRKAERINQIWSYDFVIDQTEDGRHLKLLPIVDEYSRECLTIEVERNFRGKDIVRTLTSLFKQRGKPEYLRSDNGPEFRADAVKECLRENGVKALYIEPGSPWENGYGESFNGKLRDELLKRELFRGIKEAQYLVKEYVEEYNQRRPHSALGYATPAAFASRQIGGGGRGA